MKSRMFLPLVAALLMFAAMPARAILVDISGTTNSDGIWEISVVEGTFVEHQAQLESQEWWQDFGLAIAFSDAVDDAFGALHTLQNGEWSAFFAYRGAGSGADSVFFGSSGHANDPQSYYCGRRNCENIFDGPYSYAIGSRVSPVSVPEPGTLAILGVGLAGIGLARRRKSRSSATSNES